ncbi:MAG: succinate dehydrogenase cytochrome b subunit [Thermodesulfobacteriota bacterium]
MVSIGQKSLLKKLLMAVTGLVMLLFVIAHTLGNASLFFGAGYINSYAEHIHSMGWLIWLERAVMLAVALVHIFLGIMLSIENYTSRSSGYAVRRYLRSTFSARTMIYTGGIILVFVIYHLMHFTLNTFNPEFAEVLDSKGRHDVYHMIDASFASLVYTGPYVIALLALLLHLWHGISSFLQTLGLNKDTVLSLVEKGGRSLALLIFLGMVSIPLSFYVF